MSRRGIVRLVIGAAEVDDLGSRYAGGDHRGRVSYKGHRYPAEIIAHCVWLYHRFPLSFREVEESLVGGRDPAMRAGRTRSSPCFLALSAPDRGPRGR